MQRMLTNNASMKGFVMLYEAIDSIADIVARKQQSTVAGHSRLWCSCDH